jgi:hypothetical protein
MSDVAGEPSLWIEMERGKVEIWALGGDRFKVTAHGHEFVSGLEHAQRAAHMLAEQLGVV